LFSFSNWKSKNKQTHFNTKQNTKFLKEFEVVYNEISQDLVQRVLEIKQVVDLLMQAHEFNEDKEMINSPLSSDQQETSTGVGTKPFGIFFIKTNK
jgi:hypothetical protein